VKTDATHKDVREAPEASPREASPREKRTASHLQQPFDIGRLDNEVDPPKVLLDVIHIGVAIWGLILAAGVYFFGGQDWRESLLVHGVFAFFLIAWRLAMFIGARRKSARERRAAEAESTPGENPYLDPSTPTERGRDPKPAPVDPTAETRPVDRSAESTAAEREYVSRTS
jgi:hypothetical protein